MKMTSLRISLRTSSPSGVHRNFIVILLSLIVVKISAQYPFNVVQGVNSSAFLPCVNSTNPSGTVSWFFTPALSSSSPINIVSLCTVVGGNPSYRVNTTDPNSCSLIIDVDTTTAGLYSCNLAFVTSAAASQLVAIESGPAISVEEGPSETPAGTSFTLSCTITYTGSMVANFIWSAYNVTISPKSNMTTNNTYTSEVIVSSNVSITVPVSCIAEFVFNGVPVIPGATVQYFATNNVTYSHSATLNLPWPSGVCIFNGSCVSEGAMVGIIVGSDCGIIVATLVTSTVIIQSRIKGHATVKLLLITGIAAASSAAVALCVTLPVSLLVCIGYVSCVVIYVSPGATAGIVLGSMAGVAVIQLPAYVVYKKYFVTVPKTAPSKSTSQAAPSADDCIQ